MRPKGALCRFYERHSHSPLGFHGYIVLFLEIYLSC